MEERVVITGVGAISPLGLSVEETWRNVLSGRRGIGPITLFDASALPVRFACEVKGFVPENYMEAKEARRRDRFEQFATAAASQAISQSGLEVSEGKAGRIGVMVSSAIGGLGSLETAVYTFQNEGVRRVTPFIIPMLMGNGAAGLISIDHGYMGPAFSVTSACAAGADGIGIALTLIRAGIIDVRYCRGSRSYNYRYRHRGLRPRRRHFPAKRRLFPDATTLRSESRWPGDG